MPTTTTPCHLDYYLRHGLNPVRYEMADLSGHLDRRDSLYRTLGLPASFFRGRRILEVAPGTGQNSLHVAARSPGEYVLVEPNPRAIEEIRQLYTSVDLPLAEPSLIQSKLQEFRSVEAFDVVICENWLGRSEEERRLLVKLGGLTEAGGILVITAVSPVGILPNVLRKALACRIDRPTATFAERTTVMMSAFGPHLATIPEMTRSTEDWVQDNVLNPAYLGVVLSLEMVLDELGEAFDVYGSSPRFACDWRWFKGLHGPAKEFNRHFLNEYQRNSHNFLDYRSSPRAGELETNVELERITWAVIRSVERLELSDCNDRVEAVEATLREVGRLRQAMSLVSPELVGCLDEFAELFARRSLTPEEVGGMTEFSGWFGRETLYLALERRSDT